MRNILPRYPNKEIVLGETLKERSLFTEISIGFFTSIAATMALYYAGFFDSKKK